MGESVSAPYFFMGPLSKFSCVKVQQPQEV